MAFLRFSCNFVAKPLKIRTKLVNCAICHRNLNYFSKEYGCDPNPAPIFIKDNVQSLLKSLTRVDLLKVYKKRKLGESQLENPTYKFLTDEQLQQVFDEIRKKADSFLQIPPIVPVRQQIETVISRDPALQGHDTSRYVFTDITYGTRDRDRLIAVRETDGTLRNADWDIRNRINQTYFPHVHRSIKVPKMFQDTYLEKVLERGDFVFVLDKACIQFEPDDPLFQKVVTVTYQHINDHNAFDQLRSTRHFGSLAFFLAWNKMIDNLLLELIETGHVGEVQDLIRLYGECHGVDFGRLEKFELIGEFISRFASKKGALELALQAYKDVEKQKQELEEGIKAAHGFS